MDGLITLLSLNNVILTNKEAFKLDFKKGVTISNNVALWERYNITNAVGVAMDPKLFYIENFNKRNVIISFFMGSTGASLEAHYFDIDKLYWYDKYLVKEISYEKQTKAIEANSI